ncbi:HAD family hydrolase [Lacticaseibacillus camelliae]|uniref:p-Ser-HPr phosphatase n=1 Tax=Lacticaseibacillus camelliae DSM 22697 = JCM 13995 TaxID=1423730 RepID=A0A0R2F1H7_9LACO|nr:HAD family hydrolase [Lacticaseibacillus camelliae]KRN22206.1 P-Ser-HPr phosphatase [Lacticaseibacillus camelliae DSM 22697 = JCM 13995]
MLVNAIWDLDGTLFDTYPEMLAALVKTLHYYGQVTVDEGALLKTVKRGSITATLTQLAPQLDTTPERILSHFHTLERQQVMIAQPYPEVPGVLHAIHDAGGLNLLMTHRDHSAWALLRQAGLKDLFLDGVTSDLGLPRKPAPDAVLHLVAAHQLNPERTAMIGDRKLDVIAGQNAGVKGVYFNVDGLNDAPMADVQVDHLTELLPLFNAHEG